MFCMLAKVLALQKYYNNYIRRWEKHENGNNDGNTRKG